MKKCLIGFIIMTISIFGIGISQVKASDTITFQDGSNTVTLKSPSYYGKKYGFVIKRCYYGCKYYYSIGDTPMGYSTSKVVMSNYDDYNNKIFFIKVDAKSNTPFSEFEERIEGLYGINDNSPILWSNYDVPEINWQGDIKESTGNIVHSCNAEDCINLKPINNPTFNINVSYNEEIDTGFPRAQITFNYENLDSLYKYQYSYNNKDWKDIKFQDIKDNTYHLTTYQNGKIYGRILDLYGNVAYENSELINMIIDKEGIYTYEVNISDFYDSVKRKHKSLTIFYESQNKPVYFGFKMAGDNGNELPISITHNTGIIDKNKFVNDLKFDNIYRTPMPYEYINSKNLQGAYKYSNAFVIVPNINTETDSIQNYGSEKIIIRTNIEINIGPYMYIDGVLRPSFDDVDKDTGIIEDIINKLLSPILEKLPIINQLSLVYETFSYDFNAENIPVFSISNLSFLGIEGSLPVIDFSIFVQYRDYLFLFEKLVLGYFTLVSLIKIIQSTINGGGS